MFPFPKFENSIEKKILDRGFDYYEQEHVEDVEALGNGEFSAIVEGSEDYDVFIKLENNKVSEYNCTCPYDYGYVCKHIVAVLYYIRDAEMHKEEYFSTLGDDLIEIIKKNYTLTLLIMPNATENSEKISLKSLVKNKGDESTSIHKQSGR